MTKDPVALLQRLLREPETTWLEFKQDNDDPQMMGEWISACANAAILAEKDHGFLVYGVEDKTRKKTGTSIRLRNVKKGGENLENWLTRMIEPRLNIELLDFEADGKNFAIIRVEPTYDRPVKFAGYEYIRIGANTKKLSGFPEHERSLWAATSRRKFEHSVALANQSHAQIFERLNDDAYYQLTKEDRPLNQDEIIRRYKMLGFVIEDMEGGYHITNLGAILLARDMRMFSSLSAKTIRVIRYTGADKRESEEEIEITEGYASGFVGLLRRLFRMLPKAERYIDGVRTLAPIYPETAIRELIANALIHQDFTISGAGPVVEIYSGRIEVINPGTCLVEEDRLIDERRTRNESLAKRMRELGLCEERGGGLDKAMLAIEHINLPAPEFILSKESTRVTLFAPRPFDRLTKTEKQRACYWHCVLQWQNKDYMSNTTLRKRFMLPDGDYQAVSAVISDMVKLKKILPAEKGQGKRNAKYVPYWVKSR